MEQVQRFCDFDIAKRAPGPKPHGVLIEDGKATTFVLDGVMYEVDICEQHREVLRAALTPFVSISKTKKRTSALAERNGRGRLVHRRGKATFTTKDVRTWAQEQGLEVAPAGRVPKSLVEQFEEAHSRN